MAGYKVLCALLFALLVVAPFLAKADKAGESAGECVDAAAGRLWCRFDCS
jgi:hypothetical protein